MEEANWKKIRGQPGAATTEEANARLLFSSCGCSQEVKLKVEWQMSLLSKKVNIDFTDEIASLVALYLVENFKLCNKHQTILARHLGFVTKKLSKKDIPLRLNGIW